jgi:hypothetical protein
VVVSDSLKRSRSIQFREIHVTGYIFSSDSISTQVTPSSGFLSA